MCSGRCISHSRCATPCLDPGGSTIATVQTATGRAAPGSVYGQRYCLLPLVLTYLCASHSMKIEKVGHGAVLRVLHSSTAMPHAAVLVLIRHTHHTHHAHTGRQGVAAYQRQWWFGRRCWPRDNFRGRLRLRYATPVAPLPAVLRSFVF